ncbi:MAG: paraquat-inducible protein A [Cytophagaceae bacterium]|nr:MAG: paraquat-inducible protein A [Cytophagaceae bacterium]
MNWNRWSAFFCLCGLVTFVPAVFVPAMLVANAVDGPRWYSVWSGILGFFHAGQTFLALLICCFSLVFPLLKFGLGLLCSAGGGILPPAWRRRIVAVTSWSAKYSMLDVMVIAMLIMLVKVNEYVRVLPSLGLYLFSVSIFLSALAGAALNRAIAAERRSAGTVPGPVPAPQKAPLAEESPAPLSSGLKGEKQNRQSAFPRWLLWTGLLITSLGVAGYGGVLLRRDTGGMVQSVELSRLTNRGDLRRSVEKAIALKELTKDEHRLFSRDTLRRFLELGQAVTTDAGWKEPEAWFWIEKTNLLLPVFRPELMQKLWPSSVKFPVIKVYYFMQQINPEKQFTTLMF